MIDYWCNAFTPDRAALWSAVIERDALTIKLGARGDDAFAEPAAMVERMDRLGIDTLVLPVCEVVPGAPLDEFAPYAARPDEITVLAAEFPGRFVGQWSVSPDRPGDLDAAATALAEPWCVALHNHTHSWDHPFDAAAFAPYYALATGHGVPFVMQAGASGGHRRHELGHPDAIDGPARDFPDTAFVLSHLGLPWLDETLAAARRNANVVIGTATHPPSRWPEKFVEFARTDGRERVLFGTGYPLVGHGHALAQLGAFDVDAETREALSVGNARRLFTRIPARVGD